MSPSPRKSIPLESEVTSCQTSNDHTHPASEPDQDMLTAFANEYESWLSTVDSTGHTAFTRMQLRSLKQIMSTLRAELTTDELFANPKTTQMFARIESAVKEMSSTESLESQVHRYRESLTGIPELMLLETRTTQRHRNLRRATPTDSRRRRHLLKRHPLDERVISRLNFDCES